MNFIKCLFIFIFLCSKILPINLLDSKFVLNIRGNSHYLNYYYTTFFYGNKKENQTFLLDTTSSITSSPCTLCLSCGDHMNDYFNIISNTSIIKSDSNSCSSLPDVYYSVQKNNDDNNNNINNYNKDYCNFLYTFDQKTKIGGFYLNNLISFDPITSKENSEESEEEFISRKAEFELPIGCTMNETGEFQSRMADGILGLNKNDKSFISTMYNLNIIKRMEGYGICSEFMNENEMNAALNGKWPKIIIKFNGYEFIWEPKNYYINHSSRTKYRACFGFDTKEKLNNIILGTNFMHGYDIIFDREKNRIGFARAECGRKMNQKFLIIHNKINNEIPKTIEKIKQNVEEKPTNIKITEKKDNIINENDEKNKNIETKIKKIETNTNNNNNNYNIDESKKKIIEKNNPNHYKEKVYLLIFVIFIIAIIIALINYVKCNNNSNHDDNLQEKYENVINEKEEKEEKDINKIQSSGQIIEMI